MTAQQKARDGLSSTTRRKRAPRLEDIAKEAGVSAATVDRVLNERGSASKAAREKVVAAAMRLGVRRVLPDLSHGLKHVDVILPYNTSPMFRRLDLALQRTVQMLDRQIIVHRITLDRHDDAAFSRAIASPPYRRSGLVVVGSAAARTLAAVREIRARGERAVTMVTELSLTKYVGMDNLAAGRTAGHMIGKFTRGDGRVVVLRGLNGFPATDQRVNGCIESLRGICPAQVVVLPDEETNDDPEVCNRLINRVLDEGPIGAIYNTGDGSEGIYRALNRRGLLGKVVWVAHEMHDFHSQLLALDQISLIIDQNPDAQVLAALQSIVSPDSAAENDVSDDTPAFTTLSLFARTNIPTRQYLE